MKRSWRQIIALAASAWLLGACGASQPIPEEPAESKAAATEAASTWTDAEKEKMRAALADRRNDAGDSPEDQKN